MAIPESQLATWSKQGSVTQSSTTYATIKASLEAASAKYAKKEFEVFLQGSYGNDTNIYAESDVDVVIRLDSTFHYDLNDLTETEKQAFNATYGGTADYSYGSFRAGVVSALEKSFGTDVKQGKKAVKVKANGSRRNADVVVATEFRNYRKFVSLSNETYDDNGICFFDSTGNRIENYPKQHSANCTAKHQATEKNFKPLVRIFKNMRSKLVDDGLIGKGLAPSYFIEGLLYNVPPENFSGSYQDIVLNALIWLHKTTDRTKFLCANERYYLLRDNSAVCWPIADGETFISAVIQLWNDWA